MASVFERARHAWDILRGVQAVTRQPQTGATPVRIGSPADATDDDISIISASYQFFKNWTHLEPDRLSIYSDMDEMFTYVLAAAALEAYVEDATQPDFKTGKTVKIKSPNAQVQEELERLFETIELEDRVYGDLWSQAKYGDYFTLLLVDEDKGVFDATPMEPRIVWRHEDSRRVLTGFSIGDSSENTADSQLDTPRYKPWDLVHWRIRGKRVGDPYGTPFFFDVRMVYKILKLMEEQMVIYRMNMHPDRLVFKVFTGAAGPEDRRRVVRMWRREMEKMISIDKASGVFRAEHAPWMVNQNIYWPVGTNDQVSGVEKFAGSANAGDIMDVTYMKDLFFAGVRVPKAYMGFEDSQGYRGTDTLSAQSIKFARGVKRLQKHFLQGLTRLCMLHLACKGIDARQPQNQFTLEMSPTSYLDEAHKAELYAKRYEALNYMLDIGAKMKTELSINSKVWAQFVLKEFGGWDDDMIAKLTAPEMPDSPEMTFTPADQALTFEQKAKLTEIVNNDPKMRQAFEDANKLEGLTVHECSLDTTKLPMPPKGEKIKSNQQIYEMGKQRSKAEELRRVTAEKEAHKARQEYLKELAEKWQKESE